MSAQTTLLHQQLDSLKLPLIKDQYNELAQAAAQQSWGHVEYLARLMDAQYQQRLQRTIQHRIKSARFPVLKTLEQFQWDWPKKINRLQVQNLFRLEFLEQKTNAIFLGNVGLGKSHLAVALGYAACLAAQKKSALKTELKKYLRPEILILDEVGYLPIDQHGADLLFQIISQRYERGSIVLTTNKPFKQWASIFNNDSTVASAVLDRLLHHAETVVIEGSSFRMKDQIPA
jgi:DNA replication protein DnaC